MALLAMKNTLPTHCQIPRMQSAPAFRQHSLLQIFILELSALILLAGHFANPAIAQVKPAASELLNLSIEELMNVKVTTVSRDPQKLSQVASAVFVITQDDIRRSGATSIPDALRMAPGVQVERVGTDKSASTDSTPTSCKC
jgi:iron complex outermembrane receptor protein